MAVLSGMKSDPFFEKFKKIYNYSNRFKINQKPDYAVLYAIGSSILMWLLFMAAALSVINTLNEHVRMFYDFASFIAQITSFIPIPFAYLTLLVLGVICAVAVALIEFLPTLKQRRQSADSGKAKLDYLFYRLAARVKILIENNCKLPKNFYNILDKKKFSKDRLSLTYRKILENIIFIVTSGITVIGWYSALSTFFGGTLSWYSSLALLPTLGFASSPLVISICFLLIIVAVKILIEKYADGNYDQNHERQRILKRALRASITNLDTCIEGYARSINDGNNPKITCDAKQQVNKEKPEELSKIQDDLLYKEILCLFADNTNPEAPEGKYSNASVILRQYAIDIIQIESDGIKKTDPAPPINHL